MVPLIGYPSDQAEFKLGLSASRKMGSDPALENAEWEGPRARAACVRIRI